MHGMIGKNRKGRKRKSGRRTASGALARSPVDYRAMAADWPHRRSIAGGLGATERGESYLGRLNLANRISDDLYESGLRYSRIVGSYLAMAAAPKGTSGSGRGFYECLGDKNCPVEPMKVCICKLRTDAYMDAHDAISQCTGKQARVTHMIINRVVIQDQPCSDEELTHLWNGLNALAVHFGLTGPQRPWSDTRNPARLPAPS